MVSLLTFDDSLFAYEVASSAREPGWRSLLVRTLVASHDVEEMRAPPIDDHLLVLVTVGDMSMESYSEGKWRRARYRAGAIGMTPPGKETHLRWRVATPCRTLHVYVPGKVTARVANELWDHDVTRADALAARDPVLEGLIRAVAGAAEAGVDDLYAEAAAEFLAVHLLTHHGGRNTLKLSSREDPRVRRAIAVMRERLGEPVTLAQIAAEVRLSLYHFIRVFRAATGRTPHRFLLELRLAEAQRLLSATDLPIAAVAGRCGFHSAAHLSAAFLREMGVRPSVWRSERASLP